MFSPPFSRDCLFVCVAGLSLVTRASCKPLLGKKGQGAQPYTNHLPLPLGLCLPPPASWVACNLTTAGWIHSSLSLMIMSARLLWILTPSVTCLARGLLWLLITLVLYAWVFLRLLG